TSVPHYLDLVIGIFRHGDRAPLRSFPTDRNWNSKFWILGYGELTHRGIGTMRNVGKYLKERYKTYLT
ncbi:histidine acid phosphatase, putative, partial [Ixodes scapularis]